jgi:periplasmic divalent cation tolerance protein
MLGHARRQYNRIRPKYTAIHRTVELPMPSSVTPNAGVVIVLTTAPAGEGAETLARALVEERLAACVTRLAGARSLYRWRDAIEASDEVQLVVKTTANLSARAVDRLRAIHPYDVPEVLVLPVTGGSAPYLDWVRLETLGPGGTG